MDLFSQLAEPRGATGNTIDAVEQARALCGEDLVMWVIMMGQGMAKLIVRNMDDPCGDVVLYLEATIADIGKVMGELGVDVTKTSTLEPIYRNLTNSGLDANEALETACAIVRNSTP